MDEGKVAKRNGKGQFEKGASGNPNGRPPKAVCLTSLLRDYLAEISEDERAKGKTRGELLVMALWSHAMKGNGVAFKEILARVDGPVPTVLEGGSGIPPGEQIILISATSVKRPSAKDQRKAMAQATPEPPEGEG